MRFYIVDCFAEERYQGNQLAVFFPEGNLPDAVMQAIANEMGFSETAFVFPGRLKDGSYPVRIFTPAVELPFAGHPVLGTAHVIRSTMPAIDDDFVLLSVPAGVVPVRFVGDRIFMEQGQPKFGETVDCARIAEVLSLDPGDICEDLPVQLVSTGLESYIVPLKGVDSLARCQIDHTAFAAFHEDHCKCNVLAYAREGDGVRVRVFMDDPGYLEDPATGSANGCLAAYLLAQGEAVVVRYEVSQGVEMGRPSRLYVEASAADGTHEIKVGGRAHIVAEGRWLA